jgi:hypothetical protein
MHDLYYYMYVGYVLLTLSVLCYVLDRWGSRLPGGGSSCRGIDVAVRACWFSGEGLAWLPFTFWF